MLESLFYATEKRVNRNPEKMACILTGKIESYLLTEWISQYYKKCKKCNSFVLETFSIGWKDSKELMDAKRVAEYLGTKHTEIIITEEDCLSVLPDVMRIIETDEVSSVRESILYTLLFQYISKNTNYTNIWNDKGMDVLFRTDQTNQDQMDQRDIDPILFDKECRDSLNTLTHNMELCSQSFGIKTYSPILDRSFIQMYFSIPYMIRYGRFSEKNFLRNIFTDEPIDVCLPIEYLTDEPNESYESHESHEFSFSVLSFYTLTLTETSYSNEKARMIEDEIYDSIAKKYLEYLDIFHTDVDKKKKPVNWEQYVYKREFETFFPGMVDV
jgi:asparagine synthase (glutamine-hydrolysing)